MVSLINKQLLLTAYAYLFIMEQQKAQQGSEALQLQMETTAQMRQDEEDHVVDLKKQLAEMEADLESYPCGVCLEPNVVLSGTKGDRTTQYGVASCCTKMLCKGCYEQWKKTCPHCRREVKEGYEHEVKEVKSMVAAFPSQIPPLRRKLVEKVCDALGKMERNDEWMLNQALELKKKFSNQVLELNSDVKRTSALESLTKRLDNAIQFADLLKSFEGEKRKKEWQKKWHQADDEEARKRILQDMMALKGPSTQAAQHQKKFNVGQFDEFLVKSGKTYEADQLKQLPAREQTPGKLRLNKKFKADFAAFQKESSADCESVLKVKVKHPIQNEPGVEQSLQEEVKQGQMIEPVLVAKALTTNQKKKEKRQQKKEEACFIADPQQKEKFYRASLFLAENLFILATQFQEASGRKLCRDMRADGKVGENRKTWLTKIVKENFDTDVGANDKNKLESCVTYFRDCARPVRLDNKRLPQFLEDAVTWVAKKHKMVKTSEKKPFFAKTDKLFWFDILAVVADYAGAEVKKQQDNKVPPSTAILDLDSLKKQVKTPKNSGLPEVELASLQKLIGIMPEGAVLVTI